MSEMFPATQLLKLDSFQSCWEELCAEASQQSSKVAGKPNLLSSNRLVSSLEGRSFEGNPLL